MENFATMSGTSDIPDWCYVQCGLKYDPSLPPTGKDHAELLSHSPMSACDKVHVMYICLIIVCIVDSIHCFRSRPLF